MHLPKSFKKKTQTKRKGKNNSNQIETMPTQACQNNSNPLLILLDLEFMDEVLPENSDYKESRNTV